MTELVKVEVKNGEQLVSARELHEFLEVKRDFSTWIKDRIEKYSFEEGVDFSPILGNSTESMGRPRIEYALKISMAKELSMVENNEKGSVARKYFIECERKLKELPMDSYMIDNPIERAKRWIEEQELHQLEVKQKDEVIIKVKEEVKAKEKVIDDITKDVDTPLLCKTVTDYINILHHKTKEPHQIIYKKVYDVLGRRLSKDIPYRKAQYEQKQREMVIDNIEYNKKYDLRGEDRRVPFKMKDVKSKISTLEYIVDVLGEGHALIETIAKLADVGIGDVIEKYNYYRSINVDDLM